MKKFLFLLPIIFTLLFSQTWVDEPQTQHKYPINQNLQDAINSVPAYQPPTEEQKKQQRQRSKKGTKVQCYVCNGDGSVSCGACNGTGEERVYASGSYHYVTCSSCSGAGSKVCYKCQGTGYYISEPY